MNRFGADLYTDFSGLSRLRSAAQSHHSDADKAVAEQIEGVFIGMMLKSMRSGAGGDAFGSATPSMARDLYDAQLAQHLSRGGRLGFANMILREIGQSAQSLDSPSKDSPAQFPLPQRNALLARNLWYQDTKGGGQRLNAHRSDVGASGLKVAPNTTANEVTADHPWRTAEEFVAELRPAAERAARVIGTRAEAVIAVAALETGWGKHMPKRSDGSPSYNLFGIKSHGWRGEVARSATLEFEQGAFNRRVEPFRAYSSPQQAVADFANFVTTQPRYGKALKVAANPEAFLTELHRAGYATDPSYGKKLLSILNSEPLQSLRMADAHGERTG